MRKLVCLLSLAVFTLLSASCRSDKEAVSANAVLGKKVFVELTGSNGEKVGNAELTQLSKGVKIHIEASGLVPGKHGFHIHEAGQCTPPDFLTAGGDFNPKGKKHGPSRPKGGHAGDLPNLFVGTEGKVTAEFVADHVTLQEGRPESLLKPGGTSLVIHADPDDLQTDPEGNAGARVACGKIGG